MINLHAAQMVSMPQGAKSDVAPKLPWPNGSIITAKMTAIDSEGSVILSLGGYRMRTQVPPNTPMGNVWMQLINREIPPQFRLLSDAKAASLLTEMLNQKIQKDAPSDAAQKGHRQSPDAWQKMDTDNLPFRADMGPDGRYMMLRDRQDGSTRGMVRKQESGAQFLLHGRVDLNQLGPLAFALSGETGQTWKLHLYASPSKGVVDLRTGFAAWLKERHIAQKSESVGQALEGHIVQGLPERVGGLSGVKG